MSIQIALHHETRYIYDRPASLGPQVVRLRPAPHTRTPILAYSMKVEPEGYFCNWQQDPQSNWQARLVFPKPTKEFRVTIDLVAEMSVINPFDFFLEKDVETYPFVYEAQLDHELGPYRLEDEGGPLLRKFVKSVDTEGQQRTVDLLVAVNRMVQDRVKYLIRLEPGVQGCEETLSLGTGSCRDSAWLLCQTLRRLGFASRFCSGYLVQLTADMKPLEGPQGPSRDFTDLHAWTEVYLPGAGWIGLDPTSGLLTGEGHIPLAATPDPQTAAPISGRLEECDVEFRHKMSVRRIFELPRVTKPYTEEQWSEIESLGHAIDRDLEADDVRLTMGGEPTFVSVTDMDGAEWNTAAMGPTKRRYADDLIRRLQTQFGPGGLLHYGQGKWYPGEQLPRWAFGLYWRKDGEPIWDDPSLIADEKIDYGVTARESERFLLGLCTRLGLDPKYIHPAYEDAWYYLWKERRLPTNVDPLKSNLSDEMERERLARVFEKGLNHLVGHVLPVQRWGGASGPYWITGPWFFRPETMFLVPGDSTMGFRLPLDSLPWASSVDFPWIYEEDPLAPRPPLPKRPPHDRQSFITSGTGSRPGAPHRPRAFGEGWGADDWEAFWKQMPPIDELRAQAARRGTSTNWLVRTALCAEPRHGRLNIFMPPVQKLEEYLELVSAVEATSSEMGLPVTLEGYPPPADPRINTIKVTPDPGVIEVNIHPAHSWADAVATTTTLYHEARLCGLGTEKFQLDGRHTGTGGGNHIIVGGATPADSPFLRRPDMLRSLASFWHNHPSLSYLFSTMFIGPTSQAPRIDEARNDAVYEMEIAFRQIPGPGKHIPPWLVDRIFRNLFTDVSGNTHRAEFCIDKLFAPESSSGRLGLLELRAFEMPPHERMSLAQQLLLRSLVASFWRKPYERPLVRWGTDLHDRFMLPYWVEQDFGDALQEIRDAGYPIQTDWFAPHFEFRYPSYGEIAYRGIHLELRQALEPWLVLGEEPASGATVRYVDSSVERLQVRARGLVDARYTVACNGVALPLHPTGTVGEFVAGVRYRAWQPPSCLHPTIGIHSPLTLDIVDEWNGRSIGGCTYHVVHPGGRSYDVFPVNAFEAESRRRARFFQYGHTPGALTPARPRPNRDFPMTLDLRHQGIF